MIKKGYTFIEILMVMGLIGVLSTVLIVVIKPAQQLARARDATRETDLIAIVSTIQQYSGEHSGALPDTDGNPETSDFPTAATCIGSDLACYDLASAGDGVESLVPDYLFSLPFDPKGGDAENTLYTIYVDANGHVIAEATPETKPTIQVVR
jgi:prepilin-type N-terminal cleavage/methylation domain-containing protein